MKVRASISIAIVLLLLLPFYTLSQSSEALKRELEEELAEINNKIITYRGQVASLNSKNRTLQEEIQLLDTKVETLQLQIQATELVFQDLQAQAHILEGEVTTLQQQINETKERLANNLSQLYQLEQRSPIELVFSGSDFSEFFDTIHYLRRVQEEVKVGLGELSQEKVGLDEVQEALNQKLFAQEQLVILQKFEREELNNNKRAKAGLIQQNTLQSISLESKSTALEEVAAQLRERLYVLKGLKGSVGLGDAYQQAATVALPLHINPSFLMAILKVESDLGNNVGGGHWQSDMHPRDRDAFLEITQKLGLNPDTMPVSSKPRYGWGGAMGPAQFLPTTWLAYEERISELTGHTPPNPWELEDAFAAAAIKLAAGGADRGSDQGEWEAAMKYFAGSHWQNPAYSFYGDRVMAVKELIAAQIR